MAADAVGADQHQRADANRASPAARRPAETSTPSACALALILSPRCLLDFRPVAVERGDQIAIGARRPIRPLPGRRRCAFLATSPAVVLQALEERPPLGVDRCRDQPRSGRRGLRCRRRCRHRETRCGRKRRWRPGGTWLIPERARLTGLGSGTDARADRTCESPNAARPAPAVWQLVALFMTPAVSLRKA